VKKQGLSLRYKILILLTLIPLLTLTAYLVVALKVFEQDKIAYVFDSSSNISGTMAAQVKTQLNSVLTSCKTIFQDYLNQRSFSTTGENIFRNEFPLDLVGVYTWSLEKNKFDRVALLEKDAGMIDSVQNTLGPKLDAFLDEMRGLKRSLKVPFGDDRVVMFEKFVDEKTKGATVFMVVARLSEIAETFHSALAQRLYLVSGDGQIYFGPADERENNINNFVKAKFLADGAKVNQGAETAKDKTGHDILVSYSKVGFGDLIVISTVAKEKALSAIQTLLRKSIIFFVILIAITAIVSLIASGSITRALTSLFDATQKVSEGKFDIRVNVSSTDEVGALADNFNTMAAEVARLMEQTAEKARMENELQTAKTVQETLFPETNAKVGPLSITGFYEPASECGGDWWHYCMVGNKIFLWIGDATGHGAPAALITSAAKSASTIIEKLDISPSKAMELLNRAIYDVAKGKIQMTFFLASYDPSTGELLYSNASHEAPYLLKKSENSLKKKDLVPLNEVNNPRLGQGRDTVYAETSVKLDAGDLVFFYTDGIQDIQNPGKESWGEREFIKALIAANKDFPAPEESVSRFAGYFQEHRQGAVLIDDVTFFVVKNEGVATKSDISEKTEVISV
jgi:sigma-B regulation protein RsbU (phosphoserine phosphatase)